MSATTNSAALFLAKTWSCVDPISQCFTESTSVDWKNIK